MAIIAVLTTAGISSYGWYVARSTDLKTEALLAEINGATLQYKSDHNGRLPNDESDLAPYLALHTTASPLAFLDSFFVTRVFAQTFTLTHPAGTKSVCIRTDDAGQYVANDAPCEIVYYKFSDGKFAFSAGIRTKAMLDKYFHVAEVSDGKTRPSGKSYGIFVGDSPVISRSEPVLSDAITQYISVSGNTITHSAKGLTPITEVSIPNTTIPNTTIPVTTPPVSDPPYTTPPITTGPGPWTEPETTSDYYSTEYGSESTSGYYSTEYGSESTSGYYSTDTWPETTSDSYSTSGEESTTYETPTTMLSLPETAGQCFWDSDCPGAPYGYTYSCLRDHFYDWYGVCNAVPLEISEQIAASTTYNTENQSYGNSCNQQSQCRPDEYCNFGVLDYFASVVNWIVSFFGGNTVNYGQCVMNPNYNSTSTEYGSETTSEYYSTDTWGETTSEYPTTSWY